MRIISACLSVIILLVFFSFFSPIFSQEATPSVQVSSGEIDEALIKTVTIRFLPNHLLYILITIKENFTRLFQPSAVERADFDFILSGKRLKESYLLLNDNSKQVRGNLARYNKRLEKMTDQIEKARSQNQDIAKLIGKISDEFRNHEILLVAIMADGRVKSESIASLKSFQKAVIAVDKLNPGVINRFKILKIEELNLPKIEPSPSPFSSPYFNEATPSVKPRQIIL